MADDTVNEHLIDRLKQFAAKPNDNVDGIRAVAAKLHLRASSQDKNVRTSTLERLWHKQTGILSLLVTLLEGVRDHITACSLASVLHDCVSPRSGKLRSPAIRQLICMNATQSLVKIVKHHQQNQEGGHAADALLQEIVWVLAQLAQKDSKFSSKARVLGAVKSFHNLLRTHHNNTRMVYPMLLLIKSMARNSATTAALVKDGIVSTMEKVIVVLGFSPNPKLRLALNVLNHLTKNKLCCIRVCKSGLVHLLLRIFERWERFEGKLKLRICTYCLICLQHMCSTKLGRKSIRTHNGMQTLYKFSSNCPEEKSYDILLSRVCGIINMCLEKKQLPVEVAMSPATFTLPAVREYSAEELLRGASSSRETSPGSDEEDYEEPDDDDDEGVSQEKEQEEEKGLYYSATIPVQLRDIEDLKEYYRNYREFFGTGAYFDMNKHSSASAETTKSLIEPNNLKLEQDSNLTIRTSFYKTASKVLTSTTQMVASISENAIQQKDKERKLGDAITPSISSSDNLQYSWYSPNSLQNVTGLTILSDIPSHTGYRSAHCMIASQVNSVLPFVKVGYPDMLGGDGAGKLEPLNIKDRKVCRTKLLNCVERGLHPNQVSSKVVYDLDLLTAVQVQQQASTLKIGDDPQKKLYNMDEQHAGHRDITKNHLLFESRFESGNLRKAIQIAPREYDLILLPDVNSTKHHQWFYFEVSNMDANVPYIFNIVNCEKQNSQFNFGMKPIMYSVKEAMRGHHGWVRAGTDICYYRNSYQNISTSGKARCYLTTTFTVTFQHANDICYFAYHYPYTYTQLLTQIWKWANLTDPTQIYYRAESLCLSLNNNETPLLTITAPDNPTNRIQTREIVFLTSRVHPGESNASWVMHGTLNHLLSDLTTAHKLRQRYVFKIVPMLNMEGVINGCHRCGLTDEDLNRRWSRPNPTLHPVIYHTKGLIDYCTRVLRKPPVVFCDYHGHSRRKNVFLYGCSNEGSWSEIDKAQFENQADYLMLPHLMHRFSPSFSLPLCCFKVERGREATARVTVWREFAVKRSYTMESSYCGCDQGLYTGHHLDTLHLKEVGATFCEALDAMNDDDAWNTIVPLDSSSMLFPGQVKDMGDHDSESLEQSDSDDEEDDDYHCLL